MAYKIIISIILYILSILLYMYIDRFMIDKLGAPTNDSKDLIIIDMLCKSNKFNYATLMVPLRHDKFGLITL